MGLPAALKTYWARVGEFTVIRLELESCLFGLMGSSARKSYDKVHGWGVC